MYHYILNIVIVSGSSYLQSRLEKIPSLDKFEHRFNNVKKYDPSITPVDVIIAEDDKEVLAQINATKIDRTIVVYCGSNVDSYDYMDEIWQKPLSDEGLKHHFLKLIRYIKLSKDLKLNENYLETLINSTPDLVWFKDAKGAHIKINDSFCKTVQKTKKQIEGRGHYYIWDITPDEYSKGEYVCLESEDMVMKAGKSMIFDELVKTREGMRQFLTTKTPLLDEFGKIMGTVGIARDVTDFNNISRELSLLIENIPFGIIASDTNDIIRVVNTKMEELAGLTKEQMIGTHAEVDSYAVKREITDSPSNDVSIIELNTTSEPKTLEMTKMTITDVFKNPMGTMRVFKDITQERAFELQALHNANTDFLTGLYNRRYFYNYVNENCQGKPLCVFFLDLDNFKNVNDTFGHKAGDDALVLTANILNKNFKDDLIVRNGGDEFIVLIMTDDMPKIEKITQTILNDLNSSYKKDEKFTNVTASIGVAVTSCFDEDIDKILKQSDAALYSVKNTNKGNYCISNNSGID